MTRKDYNLLAASINAVRTRALALRSPTTASDREAQLDAIDAVAYRLASDLARTNPRFDADRFLDACLDETRG